jgi:uncharacterized membrane protein HdeD (DUF308 family)
MSATPPDMQQLQRSVAESVHRHWRLYLIEGIVLVLLGVLAIVVPQIAALALTIFLGWLLLISGVVGLFMTFTMRAAPGFWWSLTGRGADRFDQAALFVTDVRPWRRRPAARRPRMG